MRTLKLVLVIGLLITTSELFSQYLPPSYQPMLNEIVVYFETIRSGNSIHEGKNSLRVINENRIVLSVKHKGKVKNLTFETQLDEESKLIWMASNQLTIDMVNKYEDFLTKTFESMHKLAEKKSKE
ncbi:MAG: hypothetical protein MI922_05480 [Bacteroidales bacterium]|nr:hypothetical protein [Bacteroidales bacterium]